jgi:hypothetical protein
MNELSLIDATFQKERTKQYHLSIQADMNEFSFCVFDIRQKKHTVFRKYLFPKNLLVENFVQQLDELFKQDDLLTLPYSSSAFMFLSQKSTLIPDSYFDRNELIKYLAFNHDLDTLDEIHYNYIASIDAYNVFTLHTYIAAEISNHIQGVRFFHQGSTFIEKVMEFTKNWHKDMIAVNLNRQFFDIIVSAGGKLKLYNTFHYMGQNDLLYFILYVSKQFKCEPSVVKLLLSGEVSDQLNYFDAIRNYFPGAQYSKLSGDNLSNGLSRVREYTYLNLFNLAYCE